MSLMKPTLLMLGAVPLALVALAACSPITALNALAPPFTHQRQADLPYGDQPRQRLDAYLPTRAAPPGGHPVVLFIYGGSWNHGERADYKFVGEALASRGVITLVSDYRLYPQVRYPEFLDDGARALAWTFKEAARLGGNPRRIFVMGHSAGAYNAAMLALDPRWLATQGHQPRELAGFIGLAGPYDFLPINNLEAQPVFFHPNYPAGSQPITHVTADAPPSFLGAAKDDVLVDPKRNTDGLAQRLKASGATVTVRHYDRLNHQTLIGVFATPLRWMAPVLDDVAGFIDRTAPQAHSQSQAQSHLPTPAAARP